MIVRSTAAAAIAALAACGACAPGALTVEVAPFEAGLPDDVALRLDIFAPEGAVDCEGLAFRDVTLDTLAASLVATTAIGADTGAIGDVPRDGAKLVVVTGTRAGLVVVEGCAELGPIEGEARVRVTLEPTVLVAPRPESPAQLISPEKETLALLATRALDEAAALDALLEVRVDDARVVVRTVASGHADVDLEVTTAGPYVARVQPRLGVGAPLSIPGFGRPQLVETPALDATTVALVRDDASGAAFVSLAPAGGSTTVRFLRPLPTGSFSDASYAVPGALTVVGRARLEPTLPPALLVVDDSGDLVVLGPVGEQRRFAADPRASFVGARAVPVGSCDDGPDAAPVALVGRGGAGPGSISLIGPGGATTHAAPDNLTLVDSVCAGVPARRLLIAQTRGGERLVLETFVPALADGAEIHLEALTATGLDGALAYEDDPDGAIVVARLAEVEVRLERVDLDTRLAVADGIALPGAPVRVGSAPLLVGGAPRLFALTALEAGDDAATPGILMVQGDDVATGAPLPMCAPAALCDVLSADSDGDGQAELFVAAVAASADGDAPRGQVLRF